MTTPQELQAGINALDGIERLGVLAPLTGTGLLDLIGAAKAITGSRVQRGKDPALYCTFCNVREAGNQAKTQHVSNCYMPRLTAALAAILGEDAND